MKINVTYIDEPIETTIDWPEYPGMPIAIWFHSPIDLNAPLDLSNVPF